MGYERRIVVVRDYYAADAFGAAVGVECVVYLPFPISIQSIRIRRQDTDLVLRHLAVGRGGYARRLFC